MNQLNAGITHRLAAHAHGLHYSGLPTDIIDLATSAILDWSACAVAGANSQAVSILRTQALAEGGHPAAYLLYWGDSLTAAQAALINGTAAHYLDYDDTSPAATGHMTGPILAATVSLAMARHSSGAELITAYVAGYELACQMAQVTNAEKLYAQGWHCTAVVGVMGAVSACARLLQLNVEQTCMALGIAATQASGLKSMFGSMCKPLHVGLAAERGLRAALLAQLGYDSCPEVIETSQGYTAVFGGQLDESRLDTANRPEFFLRGNLFKYHAACHLTHAVIEAIVRLRHIQSLPFDEIQSVTATINPASTQVCCIESPSSGLESKFSLKQVITQTLAGLDSSDVTTFSDANAQRPEFVDFRERISIATDASLHPLAGRVHVVMNDGREFEREIDLSVAEVDRGHQRASLETKFRALVEPILGDSAGRFKSALLGIADCPDVNDVFQHARHGTT